MVFLMETVELKLKQASAVLGVAPKDLQNLAQFKVLRPTRRDSFYWFDNRLLLEAKIALYLKDSLGTSTEGLPLHACSFQSEGQRCCDGPLSFASVRPCE